MPGDLYRLVYYSRNRVTGGPEAFAKALTSILATSRLNNARVGVTGALMFNSGCFAQVLEGPRSAIEDIFERVKLDERHSEVSLLTLDPSPTRAFKGWAMGFVGSSVTDAARYGGLAQNRGFNPARLAGDALFEILHRQSLKQTSPLI
jgi:hypothetical protein